MISRPSALLVLLAGCASAPPAGVAVTGNWGGTHMGLTLGESGGTIEYDCAAGTIGRVIAGTGGRFAAHGTHTPERGGPVRIGDVLPTYRAQFDGIVRGNRMTIRGRVENGVALGPFELVRGAQPTILRCL